MQKIAVATLFDITETHVVRNFNQALMQSHPTIKTEEEWIKAKRQQTNWETIMQVVSLRANPMKIESPVHHLDVELDVFGYHMFKGECWLFSFVVESDDMFRKDADPVGLLMEDLNNVPMISGLDDNVTDCNYFKTIGPQRNVYIEAAYLEL